MGLYLAKTSYICKTNDLAQTEFDSSHNFVAMIVSIRHHQRPNREGLGDPKFSPLSDVVFFPLFSIWLVEDDFTTDPRGD